MLKSFSSLKSCCDGAWWPTCCNVVWWQISKVPVFLSGYTYFLGFNLLFCTVLMYCFHFIITRYSAVQLFLCWDPLFFITLLCSVIKRKSPKFSFLTTNQVFFVLETLFFITLLCLLVAVNPTFFGTPYRYKAVLVQSLCQCDYWAKL